MEIGPISITNAPRDGVLVELPVIHPDKSHSFSSSSDIS